MDIETKKYIIGYLYFIHSYLNEGLDYDKFSEYIYSELKNRNNNLNESAIRSRRYDRDILYILLDNRVIVNFNDDFRYAFNNVCVRLEQVFEQTSQQKTDRDIRLEAFDIIMKANNEGYDISNFVNVSMNGYIDQQALADIIKKNSIRINEEELREEDRRDRIEKIAYYKKEIINAIKWSSVLLGVLIAGNIFLNLYKGIFTYIDKHKDTSKKSYTDMQTLEEIEHNTGHYDYENNEFIRS